MITLSTEDIIFELTKGDPLSIIRYGDGEAIVLNAFNDLTAFKVVLKRQLGYVPAIDQAEQIREHLIRAYQQCDIIGIPMHKRLQELSSYWVKAAAILDANVLTKTDKRCSIDVHYDLLDSGFYNNWLRDKDVVNVISCRTLPLEDAFGIQQVNHFKIAPEMKFTSGYIGDVHYPTQFNRVQAWMEKCSIEGKICLVGAGFIGKIYCNWFRERGGIAFDIGSIFDSWAGLATRGPNRGLDVEDLKHKL